MSTQQKSDGFQYRNKAGESPFENFLKYTNQKEISSTKIAEIVQKLGTSLSVLDIGTGNGDYVAMILSKVGNSSSFDLTLLEPSEHLLRQVSKRIKALENVRSCIEHPVTLSDYSTETTYDVVLASHLFYHITPGERPEQLRRMISFLKPGGKLIIVLREQDDASDFKASFKPLLFEGDFKALTLDNLVSEIPHQSNYKITRYTSESELKIPIHDNAHDTESIIAFYLDKPWHEIPETVRHSALTYIAERDGIFHQKDGIAVICR